MEIGSAVLGLPPPTAVNREEQYVPTGVTPGDELVVPNYVPTPVSFIHAASGALVTVLSESDADDNNNITNADPVPETTGDAMSMIHAAVRAAEESMRAGVSDVPLAIDTDAQPSTSQVTAVETHRRSGNNGGSSSSGATKRRPAAKDTDAPVAKKSSPTSCAAINDSRRKSTTNQPAAEGKTDPRTAPKIATTNVPRTSGSTEKRSPVGGVQTISGPNSPTHSGGRGVCDERSTSSASTDAASGGSKSPSTSTTVPADEPVRAPSSAGAEKTAPRKESTDDRYSPDTGIRLPVKTNSLSDKSSTAKSASAVSAASQPVDIVLTASDLDDDASQPERSRSVKSAVVLVPLNSLRGKSRDKERVADKTSKSDKLTSDPKKDKKSGHSSGPKESSSSRKDKKEASSSKATSAAKEPESAKSGSATKEASPSKEASTSKEHSSRKSTSGSKERSKSSSRSGHRDDRRSRSRGRDNHRRSPSPLCQMTVPRAAREAMQKFLKEYGRRSKD